MFRIIQSDYTSRGITKVRDAIKNAKLTGQTPVLADTMSLNALAEFALECKKESVDGLVGLRVPLNVQGNHGNVTLMAKTSEGLSNLASIIEAGVEHDSIPLSALQSHMKGVSCLIDHDSPMASSGSENAYREFFLALKNLLPSNDIYFSVYQYEDGHLERHSKINQHNSLIAKWLDVGKKDSLKEHCLPVAYESYNGGKAAYQRMMGRYLALNSVNSPSVRKAKGELPEWMDGSSISGELKHDFLEESKVRFFDKTESRYLGSILKDEEVVDLGVDWSLREEMYGMLSDYLMREGIQHQADVYTARLESELEVVEREGFEPYFKALISYAKYCAAEDIPTKIRGSGASSLICFLSGLSSSQCDPIKHNLDFRRFMGARIETPDIDLDVAAHKRNSIYDFLHHHVSEGSVGALATQGRQVNLHTLFEQAREVMLVRYGDGEQYDFQIPKVSVADYDLISELKAELGKYSTKVLSELNESSPILKSYMKRSPYIRELVSIGMELDGLRGNPTPHPSAIVVNDHSVRPIPFVKGKDGIVATVPHEFAKSVGLLKYDILSSKVIQGLDLAKSRLKETFEANVAKCFEGDGEGIYQFIKSNPVGLNQLTDSESSLKCLVDINPNSFPELAAFSALIRPGVSDRKDYLKRSKNKAFDDKEITDFLSDTRGFVIYEDQILQMCIDIAGMSPTDADTLRTGLKKGKQSLIDSQRDTFINGLVSRGRDKNIATKIWGRLCKYKGVYLFNKAHATEYAITTVEQALIKRDYPHVFLDTVVYNFDEDKSAKGKIAPKYIAELMGRGVTFSYPDINRVHANMSGFIKEGNGVIYPSLRFYGLSERMQGSLTSAKRFGAVNGLNDFLQKTLPDYLGVSRHSLLNVPASDLKSFKSEMSHLIKFGFFDQVGISEDVRLDELNTIEKRNILLQASDQLVDYLVDPFPESSEPNLTFIGKLEYTDNEYSELLKKQFGTGNVLFGTHEVSNQSVRKAIKRNI